MSNKISFLFLFIFCFLSLQAKTPPVVKEYYTSIKDLYTSSVNRAFDLQENIMLCFSGMSREDKKSAFSGINIHDNITYKEDEISNDTIPSNVYAQRLRKCINEDKTLRLESFTPKNSTYSSQPVLTGKGEVELCQTQVEVTYVMKNIRQLARTEYLGIVGDKIVSISNQEFNVDAVSLMLEAAHLYTIKKYKEAFQTYEKILSIEPDNANALYRLAIMTVKGEGTKKNRKNAEKLLKKAMYTKNTHGMDKWYDIWDLRKKIDDAYYYVTHIQVI